MANGGGENNENNGVSANQLMALKMA